MLIVALLFRNSPQESFYLLNYPLKRAGLSFAQGQKNGSIERINFNLLIIINVDDT